MKRRGPNRRIGLLGGSFDPPHAGHVHITRRALDRLGLDQVWWVVSPGNPLKAGPASDMDRRLEACREILAAHPVARPRVCVTGIERGLKTRRTADTLAALDHRFGGRFAGRFGGLGHRFVWLMGADNLADFHRWERWRWIAAHFPIAVLARPGAQLRAGLSPFARRHMRHRLPEPRAGEIGRRTGRGGRLAPRWVLLTGATAGESSTALRARCAGRVPGVEGSAEEAGA